MRKAFKPTQWHNIPTTFIKESELNRIEPLIDDRIVSFVEPDEPTELVPLTCKCCGAPINRRDMKCEYCGTYY